MPEAQERAHRLASAPSASCHAWRVTDTSQLFPGKQFISTVLDALDTKAGMSGGIARVYLMRAGMAGAIIGVMYLAYFTVIDAFAQAGDGSFTAIGKLVGGLIFGFALVFIYYTKSELLTSNMMVVTVGSYYRRITPGRGLRILALCYLGNFLGGLVLALALWGSTIADGGIASLMDDTIAHKLSFITEGPAGWADLFFRAILCNLMINIAMLLVYNGIIKDDVTRSAAMIMSVFVFAFAGLEHSVANTVLFTMHGLTHGIDLGLAAANVGIALVGNFIGGGLLIGWFYAFANDEKRHLGAARDDA